jgi:hypothetical protein
MLKISMFFLLIAVGGFATSSSYPQKYTLPWPGKDEILTYRSCGCADACWVVELREHQFKRLKASLRCDCEDLLIIYPIKTAERRLEESCSAINDQADKMKAISEKLKSIIENDKAKK